VMRGPKRRSRLVSKCVVESTSAIRRQCFLTSRRANHVAITGLCGASATDQTATLSQFVHLSASSHEKTLRCISNQSLILKARRFEAVCAIAFDSGVGLR